MKTRPSGFKFNYHFRSGLQERHLNILPWEQRILSRLGQSIVVKLETMTIEEYYRKLFQAVTSRLTVIEVTADCNNSVSKAKELLQGKFQFLCAEEHYGKINDSEIDESINSSLRDSMQQLIFELTLLPEEKLTSTYDICRWTGGKVDSFPESIMFLRRTNPLGVFVTVFPTTFYFDGQRVVRKETDDAQIHRNLVIDEETIARMKQHMGNLLESESEQ
ncbi:MAG: hypothetical protein PHU06_12465 [Gallionella sp.]|nr:hypothetical protein [Gallionella sp.]MDD4959406.1 hypothetical protein [Gallionella sp.]